jgi:hypothetical protein
MSPVLTDLADRVGVSAAWLCALHCALLPLALAFAPALAAWGLTGWEGGFIVFAAVLGVTSLGMGFRRHRTFRAFWFLLPGLALLALATLTPLHDQVWTHAAMMTAGGLLVGLAHLVNLRLVHGHVHDASCGHLPPAGGEAAHAGHRHDAAAPMAAAGPDHGH